MEKKVKFSEDWGLAFTWKWALNRMSMVNKWMAPETNSYEQNGIWKFRNIFLYMYPECSSKLNVPQYQKQKIKCLSEKGKLDVPQKGQAACPSKGQPRCPSKRESWISLKKDNLGIHQKGHTECLPNRASWMSPEKGKLNVPWKGHVECPQKRACWMSPK